MFHILLAIIYLAFISLGLPDALLGSAWPVMHGELGVPLSFAGIVSLIIAAGTVVSSLLSDRLTHRFGAGKVTAVSVAMTALALLGFSLSDSFWMLCVLAVPYGLGAGSVDAALNNYVALHYASRHMSWLHCMWGLGALIGPVMMGWALTGVGWNGGYRAVAIIQIALAAFLFVSLPLWKRQTSVADEASEQTPARVLSLREVVAIPGAKEIMLAFFCYCGLEQTAGLWAGSYLALHHGVAPETAAFFASMFYIGLTAGRAVSGFVTMKLNDVQMIRLGEGIVAAGVACILLPLGGMAAIVGLILVGIGCAPIYPCIIHSTPAHFGAERSQALIGVQMASAYIGICLMPPLFGLIANHVSVALFPAYMLLLLVLMAVMIERVTRVTHAEKKE